MRYNAQSSLRMGIRALNPTKLGFTKHPSTAKKQRTEIEHSPIAKIQRTEIEL